MENQKENSNTIEMNAYGSQIQSSPQEESDHVYVNTVFVRSDNNSYRMSIFDDYICNLFNEFIEGTDTIIIQSKFHHRRRVTHNYEGIEGSKANFSMRNSKHIIVTRTTSILVVLHKILKRGHGFPATLDWPTMFCPQGESSERVDVGAPRAGCGTLPTGRHNRAHVHTARAAGAFAKYSKLRQ